MPLVAATGAVAIAVEDGDVDLLDDVHAALVAGAGLDELLGVLTSGGHTRGPGFACVAREPDRLRLLVRGSGAVAVHGGPDDGHDVTAAGLATWREEVLEAADGLDLRLGDATVLLWTPSATTTTSASPTAPPGAVPPADDHTRAAPPAPDHTTVVARGTGTAASAPGAAPPPPRRTELAGRPAAAPAQPDEPAPRPADDATLAELPPAPSADDDPAATADPTADAPDATVTGHHDEARDEATAHDDDHGAAPVTADGLIGGVPRRRSAPPEERPGDHDGRTVVEVALPADHAPAPRAPTPAGGVPGLRCRVGHANPPHAATCRSCGAPLDDAAAEHFERPTVARVVFADGRVIELDRPHLLGRSPSPDPALGLGELVGLHTIPDEDRNLSRNHVAVHVEGWSVAIEDLGSLNGTRVALPGKEPVRLRAGERAPLVLGARVELADVATFELEAPR